MTSWAIAAIEVPRWAPEIVISDLVAPSEHIDILGYRSPSRFLAPEIQLSQPQPLLVTGGKFTIVAEHSGLVPGSTYLFGEYAWPDLLGASRTIAPIGDKPTLVCGNAAWTNYYHWMFQCLAPVLIARQLGLGDEVQALVPPLNPVYRESLDLCGMGPSRRTELTEGMAALPKRGIYSNLTTGDFAFLPHPAIVAGFESLAECVPRSAYAGRRVFISRTDSAHRRMVNEPELRERLAADGYAVVVASQLSLAEQIALFRDASLIVAQHGAALTNLLFARRGDDGPKIVELHQDNYLHQAFLKICQVKRLHYTAIVSRTLDPGPDGRHFSTWAVDMDAVLRVLKSL